MKTVLLSFDIEEFDMPLEYGASISLSEQIQISTEGTRTVLDILKEHEIKATFFSTVVFAVNTTDMLIRIKSEGHEIASHGFYHSSFKNEDLLESKTKLEELNGGIVTGFRMPRMMAVSNEEIQKAGYLYNSSMNPTYLPGKYNNLLKPRSKFTESSVIQIPASVTPLIRFPLFWLSFHHLPPWLYKLACQLTIYNDHYLNIYFHPWEFTDLTKDKYRLPQLISKNSGMKMIRRFNEWIIWMKKQGYTFSTITNFLDHESP